MPGHTDKHPFPVNRFDPFERKLSKTKQRFDDLKSRFWRTPLLPPSLMLSSLSVVISQLSVLLLSPPLDVSGARAIEYCPERQLICNAHQGKEERHGPIKYSNLVRRVQEDLGTPLFVGGVPKVPHRGCPLR